MPNEAEYKELRGKIEEKKFINSSYRKKKEVESMAAEKVVNQVVYLEEGEKLK